MQIKPGLEYELHVLKIIDRIIVKILGKTFSGTKYKHNVRVAGSSGIVYQIDILGEKDKNIFLIECKDYSGKVDYKTISSFLFKCVDISKRLSDHTIYAVVIDHSGFTSSGILTKYNEIWNLSGLDLEKQIKLLRVSPDYFNQCVVVYDFNKDGIDAFPLVLLDESEVNVEKNIDYLRHGESFSQRIYCGLQILSSFDSLFSGKSTALKKDIRLICFENIGNSYLHLGEYFDTLYFADSIKQIAAPGKNDFYFYESELLSTIATYKRLQISNNRSTIRPGLKKIKHLQKLIENPCNIQIDQRVSIQLFLGLWVARYSDYEFGIKQLKECSSKAKYGMFRDSKWHHFVSLVRLGELVKDKSLYLNYLKEAKNYIKDLREKHKSIGKELIEKVTKYRDKKNEN